MDQIKGAVPELPTGFIDKRPPLKKWRILHGQHTQDDPRFDCWDFRAPAGTPLSPYLAPTIGPDGRTVLVNPRLPHGDENSPFNNDGTRKSITYQSRIYQESMCQRFKLTPPDQTWQGDIFESRFNMLLLDREKYALVTDPYMNENKQDRLARLKREIAELEAGVVVEEQEAEVKKQEAIGADLEQMTLEQLKEHAGRNGIVLRGVRSKEEALRLIRESIVTSAQR